MDREVIIISPMFFSKYRGMCVCVCVRGGGGGGV